MGILTVFCLGGIMDSIKDIIGKNLAELRRQNKLTQQQVADIFGYSGKAVSRWERGETLPDIEMLAKICEYYGVKLEYLLQKEQPGGKNPYVIVKDTKSRLFITLFAFLSVWILASVIFVYSAALEIPRAWMIFIFALPVSGIVLYICNRHWGNRLFAFFIGTFLLWTSILAFYLWFIEKNLWMFFIVGIPVQLILILILTLKGKDEK